jgi:hypothetical protein
LPFAFLNFKNEEYAERIDEILKDNQAFSKVIYPKGTIKNQNKVLIIQDLVAYEDNSKSGEESSQEKKGTKEAQEKGNQELAAKLTERI